MSASRSMDTSEMAMAIRNNDYAGYQRARYPAVTDGDEVVFHDEDFSDVDFAGFNMGFMVFLLTVTLTEQSICQDSRLRWRDVVLRG